MPPANPPVGYRIRQGETLAAYIWSGDNVTLGGHFRILYDDGSQEDWSFDQLTTGTTRARLQMFTNRTAGLDGWVVAGGFTFQAGTRTKYGMTYAQVGIVAEPGSDETWRATICQGYIYFGHTLSIGEFIEPEPYTLYVFQGTIAEDATAGTHIVTATFTPATGSEFLVAYGNIQQGNTATSQTSRVSIMDNASRELAVLLIVANTSASIVNSFPVSGTQPATNAVSGTSGATPTLVVSGAQQLILKVTTAAVSVTQTFSVALLVRGGVKPTVVLADTVGTPTPTTNTDAFFGEVQPV